MPDDVPDDAACFAYINPLTAHLLVERFCGPHVRRVAITAATSTIGGHLAELLRLRGIRPVALVRGTPGRTVADRADWGDVVEVASADWPHRLREAFRGRGPDLVFDCVGGPQGESLVDALAHSGVLAHYGLLSGRPLPRTCFSRSDRRTEMFRLRDVVHAHPVGELPALFRPVFAHLRAGRLRTRIARRVPLAGLPDAFSRDATGPGKLAISYDA